MTFEIFVYCDDPSHAPKREPIDVFIEVSGGWHEKPVKGQTGRSGNVGTGMHMLGDTPAPSGWAVDPDGENAPLRTRYELVCTRTPSCRRRPIPATEDRLFAVLDAWRAAGVHEQALSVLAATLGEQAKRRMPPS